MSTETNRKKINLFMPLARVFLAKTDIEDDSVDKNVNNSELEKEINASYARCDDMEKKHTGFIVDISKEEQSTGRRYDEDLEDFKKRLSNNKLTKRLDMEEHTENKPQNMEHEIN